ncbi:GNAT family N-acetyltransferase [Pseudomonadota bacterium AL_CKDN230030165-1A_HGKHYDSX7]
MFRNATPNDFAFFDPLIKAEAAKGHFNSKILNPPFSTTWDLELKSVLQANRRLNGLHAQALIWEEDGNPIGFVILSAGPENKGNELWMSAIAPNYRGRGNGKAMISALLENFQGKNLILLARCNAPSKTMLHLLTTHDFELMTTDSSDCHALRYTK